MPLAATAAFAIIVGALVAVPGMERIGAWRPLGAYDDEVAAPNPSANPRPEPRVERPTAPAATPTPFTNIDWRIGVVPAPPTSPAARSVTPSPRTTRSPATTGPDAPANPQTRRGTVDRARLRALEDAVVRLTNAERVEAGCEPLEVDPRLRRAARKHSRDMAVRDYIAHVNPEGQTPGDRMAAAGYPYGYAENIAWGYTNPRDVVEGWMGSPGHRRNILDCENTTVGVGAYMGPEGHFWTQDFGRE